MVRYCFGRDGFGSWIKKGRAAIGTIVQNNQVGTEYVLNNGIMNRLLAIIGDAKENGGVVAKGLFCLSCEFLCF